MQKTNLGVSYGHKTMMRSRIYNTSATVQLAHSSYESARLCQLSSRTRTRTPSRIEILGQLTSLSRFYNLHNIPTSTQAGCLLCQLFRELERHATRTGVNDQDCD